MLYGALREPAILFNISGKESAQNDIGRSGADLQAAIQRGDAFVEVRVGASGRQLESGDDPCGLVGGESGVPCDDPGVAYRVIR